MIEQSLCTKNQFIGLDNSAWLYSGAESPPLKRSVEAVQLYMENRGKGPKGRELNDQVEQSLRRNLATLVGGSSDEIALMSNTSEAISAILHALDLQVGENIVIHTLEFPSGVLPSLMLKEKGVELRIIDHTNWEISETELLDNVDEKTRIVLTSHVSFISGARIDYKSLYSQLKRTDTLLLLDVTQSLGVVPVELQYADFLVCSSYKWLISTHGLGILALNSERTKDLLPISAGWRSVKEIFHAERFASFEFFDDARRFELGYPSYPSIYAMEASTSFLLDMGIPAVEKHVIELGTYLIDQLDARKFELLTPTLATQRAGNISFHCAEGEQIANTLMEKKVYVWGGDSRLRASIHLYNDQEDLDRFLEELDRVL